MNGTILRHHMLITEQLIGQLKVRSVVRESGAARPGITIRRPDPSSFGDRSTHEPACNVDTSFNFFCIIRNDNQQNNLLLGEARKWSHSPCRMWNDEDNNPYGTSFERRDSSASSTANPSSPGSRELFLLLLFALFQDDGICLPR